MAIRRFISYKLEDGSEVLFTLNEDMSSDNGYADANVWEDGIEKAKRTFDAALDNVRLSALQIRRKFHELEADEVELKFGLTTTGELGNNVFAVCNVGVEANYEVTLKWKKRDIKEIDEQIKDLQEKKRLLNDLDSFHAIST